MAWVYILRGASGRFYIGHTTDLSRRMNEHLRGSCHTTKRLGDGIVLAASARLADAERARTLEKKLKALKNGGNAVEYLRRNFPTFSSPD